MAVCTEQYSRSLVKGVSDRFVIGCFHRMTAMFHGRFSPRYIPSFRTSSLNVNNGEQYRESRISLYLKPASALVSYAS
jgi:hypothetical protein